MPDPWQDVRRWRPDFDRFPSDEAVGIAENDYHAAISTARVTFVTPCDFPSRRAAGNDGSGRGDETLCPAIAQASGM
jgi:hypothetical protein